MSAKGLGFSYDTMKRRSSVMGTDLALVGVLSGSEGFIFGNDIKIGCKIIISTNVGINVRR